METDRQDDVAIPEPKEVAGLRSEVRRLWNGVLPASALDDDQGFFQSGGSSIDMLALLSAFNKRFPGAFSLVDLYEQPTIDLQVEHLLATAGITTDQTRPHLAARRRLAEMRRERRASQSDAGSDAR